MNINLFDYAQFGKNHMFSKKRTQQKNVVKKNESFGFLSFLSWMLFLDHWAYRIYFSRILAQNFESLVDIINPSFCVILTLEWVFLLSCIELKFSVLDKDSRWLFSFDINLEEFLFFGLLGFYSFNGKVIVNDQVVKGILYESLFLY